jgi:glycosyltransferase involved in cell wall biosynthesis
MVKLNPLVTILMPVFNGEKYLTESIESIFNQNYHNYELLLIDDFSKDQSIQLIESFDDKRIKIIKNTMNIGQAATMNIGIAEAKGDIIFRLDQDDISTPDRLQVQMEIMNNHDNIIVGTWAQVINEFSKIIGYVEHPIENKAIVDSLAINCPLTHSSICMTKKDLIELKGYDVKYSMAMDWDLWIRAAKKNIKFLNIPDYLVKLRTHPNQSSEINISQLNFEKLKLIKNTENIVISQHNRNVRPVWEFYLETINTPKRINVFLYIYKIIKNFTNYKFLIYSFTLIFYHRILRKPNKYYHTPIIYKKINEFMRK